MKKKREKYLTPAGDRLVVIDKTFWYEIAWMTDDDEVCEPIKEKYAYDCGDWQTPVIRNAVRPFANECGESHCGSITFVSADKVHVAVAVADSALIAEARIRGELT